MRPFIKAHSINLAGPVYDVVMTRSADGGWLVLIDTSESGKLEDGVRLRPFRETGDVKHLTEEGWTEFSALSLLNNWSWFKSRDGGQVFEKARLHRTRSSLLCSM